MAYERVKPT